MLILLSFGAFLSTMLGGLFALRLKDSLHLILGFSAGAVVGVAFFDLLPEALALAGKVYSTSTILTCTAIGFALYLVLDRFVLLHGHHDDGHDHDHHHAHGTRGTFGALSLSFHSFLDGLGIALAFQVSPAVGAVVTAAVLSHDFSDGINTVSMILKNGGSRRDAFVWLAVDAAAPIVGVITASLFVISDSVLGLLLAVFSGFFLYIGASDLIPESYHGHSVLWTTISTVLGMGTLYAIITLAAL